SVANRRPMSPPPSLWRLLRTFRSETAALAARSSTPSLAVAVSSGRRRPKSSQSPEDDAHSDIEPKNGTATSRLEGSPMGVIIIREMVGTSPRSWSDAARQAVSTASRTVRNIRTVEVVKSTAAVENGEIVEYRVEIKIGFEYEGA